MHRLLASLLVSVLGADTTDVLRVNQVGYLPDAPKVAVLCTVTDAPADRYTRFTVRDRQGRVVLGPARARADLPFGPCKRTWRLDFTALRRPGEYTLDASDITADSKVRAQIKQLQEAGYGHYPVCVAKTQYSFSTDPKLRGAPSHHVVNVREVRLAAGAEFIVMICGDIMTMPGLPKVPAADSIDIDASGKIVGLF